MLVNGDPGDPESSSPWPIYADLLPCAIHSRAFDCQGGRVRTLVGYLVRTGDHDDVANPAGRADVSGELNRRTGTLHVHISGATDPVPMDGGLASLIGLGFDVVGYGRRSEPAKEGAQQRLLAATRKVLEEVPIRFDQLPYTQTAGDCMYVFLPSATDPTRVLSIVLRAITRHLADDNDCYRDRIRLRMAISLGLVGPGSLGLTGPLITDLSRLMDSQPIRKAVLDCPNSDIVGLISNDLLKMIRPSARFLSEFPLTLVRATVREYDDLAWLWTSPPELLAND